MKKIFLFLLLFASLQSNGQNPLSRLLKKQSAGYCSNADANAYITATGITDGTIKDNLCWLFDTLSSTGIWTKGRLINPVAGGTAGTHAVNGKSPGTYNLTFNGTWTHASTGMKGNGSTGYANTGFDPKTVWTDSLGSIALYSRTAGAASGTITEMGASNGAFTQNTSIFIRFADTYYGLVNCSGISSNVGNTASDGFYLASRYAHPSTANRNFLQKNATQTQFSEGAGLPDLNLYVGALNSNGTAANFSNKEFTFIWIGDALSTTEATTLYNIVIRWNTKMGR